MNILQPYHITMFYTFVLASITIILIPRKDIKRLALWAIVFGYIFNLLLLISMYLLGIEGGYHNYGPFGFWNVSFFPPMAWTVYFIIYLYYLPHNRLLRYATPFVAAVQSTFLANVLFNLEVYTWGYGRVVGPYLIYLTWHLVVTFLYDRFENKILIYNRE